VTPSNLHRLALAALWCAGAIAAAATAPSGTEVALVPNQEDGTLSVIDTASNAVLRTIPSDARIGAKIQAVAASAARTFVVDAAGNALLQVDAQSGRTLARIDVGHGPEGASMAPSGEFVAVCVEEDNAAVLVDARRARVVQRIATQGRNPEHCVFSTDSRLLMTSNENSDDVDVIDLAQHRSVARIPTAGHPRGIAWLPGNQFAYVAQETAGGVDVVDVRAGKVAQSIKTGLRPAGATASRDGKRVYVSNGGDGTVSVIDTAAGKVIATLKVGKRPWNMALTRNGAKLFVANGRSNSVSVIDTSALKVIAEIPVGRLPWGVTIP